MRDSTFGTQATPSHSRKTIIARIQPHAITALVGSVFLSLIASLSMVYLTVVLPSFDKVFSATGPAEVPAIAYSQAPEPWFGAGAFSAATDSPPLLPAGITAAARLARPADLPEVRAPGPALSSAARQGLAAPLQVIAGAPPFVAPLRPAGLREAVVAGVPVALRPTARPPEIVTIAASMSARNVEIEPADPVETALAALALPASPRPEPRPARYIARASAAAAEAAEQVQLASLRVPESTGRVPGLQGPGFSGQCSSRLARAIPRRPGNARSGSAFVASLTDTAGGARDAAVVREALAGNVPDFLRRLVPVTFTGTLADGRQAQITICVTPDYLAIGSNRDYVRVPLGLRGAGQVAEAFNMMLPTTRMVDAIYAQAAVHLAPQPMPAGGQMVSTGYFLRHNATVQRQLAAAGAPLGALVAGQKKDLVLTNRLASNPGKVAIYGWHRTNGRPIQPLTTVHGAAYADYSHGIRLVSRTAYLNGRPVDLQELLMDGRYARLINKDGAIGGAAIRIAAR